MREILFRGFHKCENGKETIYIDGQAIKGKWVFGDLTKNPREKCSPIITEYKKISDTLWEEKAYIVIPETIGQYINRQDVENKQIFEGCRCKHYINVDFIVAPEGVVEYLDDRYILRYNDRNYTDFMFIKSKDIQILGTIFDKEVNDNE